MPDRHKVGNSERIRGELQASGFQRDTCTPVRDFSRVLEGREEPKKFRKVEIAISSLRDASNDTCDAAAPCAEHRNGAHFGSSCASCEASRHISIERLAELCCCQ